MYWFNCLVLAPLLLAVAAMFLRAEEKVWKSRRIRYNDKPLAGLVCFMLAVGCGFLAMVLVFG